MSSFLEALAKCNAEAIKSVFSKSDDAGVLPPDGDYTLQGVSADTSTFERDDQTWPIVALTFKVLTGVEHPELTEKVFVNKYYLIPGAKTGQSVGASQLKGIVKKIFGPEIVQQPPEVYVPQLEAVFPGQVFTAKIVTKAGYQNLYVNSVIKNAA